MTSSFVTLKCLLMDIYLKQWYLRKMVYFKKKNIWWLVNSKLLSRNIVNYTCPQVISKTPAQPIPSVTNILFYVVTCHSTKKLEVSILTKKFSK